MVYSDGSVYIGGWENFKFHGHGKLVQEGGVVFEGEWREGRMHGSGRAGAQGAASDAPVEGDGERATIVGDVIGDTIEAGGG